MSETTTPTTPTATALAPTPDASKDGGHAPDALSGWLKAGMPVEGSLKDGRPEPAKPEADPAKTEAKAETKADAKPEAKAPETKVEETPKAETAKVEADPKDKQLKDTRDAFTRERQRNKELERQIAAIQQQQQILEQKLNGTYEEPKTPSVEDQARQASLMARVDASFAAAVSLYGEADVQRLVTNEDALYRELEKDPAVNARVLNAKLPMVEAYKVAKEHEERQKYGVTDLGSLREAIKAEMTNELKESIRQDLMKEIRGKQQDEVRGLGGVPNGMPRQPENKAIPSAEQHFNSLFPLFQAKAG